MLKRKPTTQYAPDGEVISVSVEPEDPNISTPEEIKNRKIYRVKRQAPQSKTGFILKSKLLPDILEEQLLQDSKSSVVDFLSIPDEEVKEISPEKSKPLSEPDIKPEQPLKDAIQEKVIAGDNTKDSKEKEIVEKPNLIKYSNPFNSILQKIESKAEEDVVSSFISSGTPKIENIATPLSFLGTPQKSALESIFSVEALASVDHASRGGGFIEIAKGEVNGKKISSIIFKNQIRSVVYQAGITSRSEFKECNSLELGEDDGNSTEMEIDVYRKKNDKFAKETLRILISTAQKDKTLKAMEQIRSYLAN